MDTRTVLFSLAILVILLVTWRLVAEQHASDTLSAKNAALVTALRGEAARSDSVSLRSKQTEHVAETLRAEAAAVRADRDAERERADVLTEALVATVGRFDALDAVADRDFEVYESGIPESRAPAAAPEQAPSASDTQRPDTVCDIALASATASRLACRAAVGELTQALEARELHALHADTGWALERARGDTLAVALSQSREATGAQARATAAATALADNERAQARRYKRQRDAVGAAGIVAVLLSLLSR